MKRTLKIATFVLAVVSALGWYFLAPPLGFYSTGITGKLKTEKNNSFLVYNPRYRIHRTGMSVQSGNFKQGNEYFFCWFWSGYGIKSMKIYSDTGQLLHDKSYGTRKDVVSTSSFSAYFDAEQDWLNRDASVYLTPSQGNSFNVVVVDYLGNQFEDTIKTSGVR